MKYLSENLKAIRRQMRKSQEEFAEWVGAPATRGKIDIYENRKPTPNPDVNVINAIATKITGLTTDMLLNQKLSAEFISSIKVIVKRDDKSVHNEATANRNSTINQAKHINGNGGDMDKCRQELELANQKILLLTDQIRDYKLTIRQLLKKV